MVVRFAVGTFGRVSRLPASDVALLATSPIASAVSALSGISLLSSEETLLTAPVVVALRTLGLLVIEFGSSFFG